MTRKSYLLITNLLLLIASVSPVALASSLKIDQSRVVFLAGVIGENIIPEVANPMLQLANDGTGNPIDLVISSPGGSVIPGFMFINVMESIKADGVSIRCFVLDEAASMAFQILVHCNERYTLDKALLLWHRVGISTGFKRLTAPLLADLYRTMFALDQVMLSELVEAIDMPSKEVLKHFNKETMHVGQRLAKQAPRFIRSLPSVDGLMEALITYEKKRVGASTRSTTDQKKPTTTTTTTIPVTTTGRIIYIREGGV